MSAPEAPCWGSAPTRVLHPYLAWELLSFDLKKAVVSNLPVLQSFNTVPHVMVSHNHKLFHYYFLTVMFLLLGITLQICDTQDI